jgi:hypothetical protein
MAVPPHRQLGTPTSEDRADCALVVIAARRWPAASVELRHQIASLFRELKGNVRRAFDAAVKARFKIIIALQNLPSDPFGAENQAVGFSRPAMFGVDVEGRHQVDLSRCP